MANVRVKHVMVNESMGRGESIEKAINDFLKEINEANGHKRLIDIKYSSRQINGNGPGLSEALIVYEID